MKTLTTLAIVLVVLSTAVVFPTANSQDARFEPPQAEDNRPALSRQGQATNSQRQAGAVRWSNNKGNQAAGFFSRTYQGRQASTIPGPSGSNLSSTRFFSSLQGKVNDKLREYASAKDSKQKKELEKEISELLSKQFDERLKEPQRRVEQSRKRVDELKSQIKNRNKADEIVELRLKVLTNEALGLGWGHGQHPMPTLSMTSYAPNSPNGFLTVPMPALPSSPAESFPSTARSPRPLQSPHPGQSPRPAQSQIYRAQPLGQNPPTIQTQPATLATDGNRTWAVEGQRGTALAPKTAVQSTTRNDQRKGGKFPSGFARQDDQPSVHQLLRDYQTASDDSERKAVEKELKLMLQAEFKQYQAQLVQSAKRIENQISELEDNLSKRKR